MKTSFNQVGIVSFSKKPEVGVFSGKLKEWLLKRDLRVLEGNEQTLDAVIREADLIVCLGGDGTILRLAGRMIQRIIPVLGVNMGSLGFLTEVKVDEVFDELKLILSGQYEIENRLMLSCLARREGGSVERRFQALNDIVINREGLTRYMYVDLKSNGERVTRFPGDGLIVATPTGSTAYSLSAGGPIVHPGLNTIIATPICPHVSALRSIILSADKKIEIQITCDREQDKALLTADGQESVQIDKHFTVEITASENKFPLIKSSKRSYLGTLQEKFKIPV